MVFFDPIYTKSYAKVKEKKANLAVTVFWHTVIWAFFLAVLVSLYIFLLYIFPKRTVSSLTPKGFGLQYEEVALASSGGIELAGWFIPNKNSKKAIIVCHGYPADKGDVFGVTEFLARDYNLLYFDFRAMGTSQGRVSTLGWREREDFLTAVRFLRERGFKDIGAFGFSVGAAAIFMASSPEIECIVSDSAYAKLENVVLVVLKKFGFFRYPLFQMMKFWAKHILKLDLNNLAPVKYIANLKIPILLIHCKEDTLIPVNEAVQLHEANPQSELWLIPKGGHGESAYSQEYEKRIGRFFKDNL